MESNGSQQVFFQHIKTQLPPHLSMVDEVAEVLNISNDSAYRRIRGEKPIDLEEIKKLCLYFKISLDQILHLDSNSFIFSGKLMNPQSFTMELYLEDLLNQIMMIHSYENKELYYLPKDIPIFHHFNFPELTGFKYFFWMKTVFEYPQYARAKFNISDIPIQWIKMGEKILDIYNKFPHTKYGT
ncbi:MAG: helix-turn-helix domain-containing protein [Chitinophagaceae bacterium]